MKNLVYNFFVIFLIVYLNCFNCVKIEKETKQQKSLVKRVRTECKVEDCVSCKEGSANECEKCMDEYVLQDKKCYSKIKNIIFKTRMA